MLRKLVGTYSELVQTNGVSILNKGIAIKHIVFFSDGFVFDDSTDVVTQSVWETAIYGSEIYVTPRLFQFTDKSEEAKIFQFKSKKYIKTEDAELKYQFKIPVSLEYWNKLKTFDNCGLKVGLIDFNDHVYLINENDTFTGFETSLIQIGNPEIGKELVYTTIDLYISKQTDWSKVDEFNLPFNVAVVKVGKPIVETLEATGTLNGLIISDRGSAITEKGFYYSKTRADLETLKGTKIVSTTNGNDIIASPTLESL